MSAAHLGEELSPDTAPLPRMLAGGEGGGPSPGAGTKTKISEAQKGKSLSPETRAKISDSLGTQIYVYDTQGSRR
jgi:hypothetical protein